MKNITKSLIVIGAVAAIAIGGTIAYFSDTETSTGNTFTAGAIDLKVDSQQHYNNAVCDNTGHWALEGTATATVPQYPVIGSVCGGTWGQTQPGVDITNEQFFNFGDIKPGDSGENTISLHVINNDAYVCAAVSNLTDRENGQSEPEALVDTTTGEFQGELSQTMNWIVWRDDGAGSGGVKGDNIQNGTEQTLAEGHPVNGILPVYDSTTGPALAGGSTAYLGVKWEFPSATGNAVQTDSLTGDISFKVVQSRNNSQFVCGGFNPNSQPPTGPVDLSPTDDTSLTSDFVILAKTGITNIPASAITGNIGAYPIAGTAIGVPCSNMTGTGKIYDRDGLYAGGGGGDTTCRVIGNPLLLAATNDMVTAYNNVAAMTGPTATELGFGNIGGMTLAPGIYKWSTGVTIPTDVTLSGGANDVWIFQIAGDLSIASGGNVSSGIKVLLAGGAQAKNVFWQVGGGTGATLGTYSTFNGTILSAKQIIMQTGAVLNGNALAQTQVTLDANIVSAP